jgi:hypothetical protein
VTDRPLYTRLEAFEPKPQPDTVPPAKESHLPGPPRMPSGLGRAITEPSTDPLVDMANRLGMLSDAVLQPDGLVARMFAEAERVAKERHAQLVHALTTIADGVTELHARVTKLDSKVEANSDAIREFTKRADQRWVAHNETQSGVQRLLVARFDEEAEKSKEVMGLIAALNRVVRDMQKVIASNYDLTATNVRRSSHPELLKDADDKASGERTGGE